MPREEVAKLNTAAVHNWLQLGGPGGDGPSAGPVWGQTFTAKDTYWRYMSWAVFHGLRWLTARSFSQALRRFGVMPARNAQERLYVFPDQRPPVLDEYVPCPRLSDPTVHSPALLPWLKFERDFGLMRPGTPESDRLIALREAGELRELDQFGQVATHDWTVYGRPEVVPVEDDESVEPGPEAAVSEPVEVSDGLVPAEGSAGASAGPVDREQAEEAAASSWPPASWSERQAAKLTVFAAASRDGQPTSG